MANMLVIYIFFIFLAKAVLLILFEFRMAVNMFRFISNAVFEKRFDS